MRHEFLKKGSHTNPLQKWRRMHIPLLLCVYTILAIGLLFIYTVGQQIGGRMEFYWLRQLIWIAIGTGILLFLAAINYHALGKKAWQIYLATLSLLILVLIFGREVNSAKSWLSILPGLPALQPTEFMKLGLINLCAWLASRHRLPLSLWTSLALHLLLLSVPIALIALQPDLGSSLLLVPPVLIILFISGIKKKLIFYSVLIVIIVFPLFYMFGLKSYQKKRIAVFFQPSKQGWNALQSKLAVGSGGMKGKGIWQGTQHVLGFLPKPVTPTDFIFSVIAEETGFIGALIIIAILMALLLMIIWIASKARDPFGRNLSIGIATLLWIQAHINIGMTIGLAPIIGLPLPFISYGGSSMLLIMACIGIIQSVYIHRDIRSIGTRTGN